MGLQQPRAGSAPRSCFCLPRCSSTCSKTILAAMTPSRLPIAVNRPPSSPSARALEHDDDAAVFRGADFRAIHARNRLGDLGDAPRYDGDDRARNVMVAALPQASWLASPHRSAKGDRICGDKSRCRRRSPSMHSRSLPAKRGRRARGRKSDRLLGHQASRQLMQKTPARARHSSEIASDRRPRLRRAGPDCPDDRGMRLRNALRLIVDEPRHHRSPYRRTGRTVHEFATSRQENRSRRPRQSPRSARSRTRVQKRRAAPSVAASGTLRSRLSHLHHPGAL